MTTPATPITKPTKAYVALIGTVLTIAVPLVTSLLTYLPPEWSAVVSGIIGLLTVFGVYKVPNKPTGDVVVPESSVSPSVGSVTLDVVPNITGYDPNVVADRIAKHQQDYQNPWPKP